MEHVSTTTMYSEAMVTGKDNNSARSLKAAVSTQQKVTTTSQPGWSTYMQMQASYGNGHFPPPFFTSSVAASGIPHPYMWGNQEFLAMEKTSSNQMLADDLGDVLVSKPAFKLAMGLSSNASTAGSESLMLRLDASGDSQPVALGAVGECEEVISEQQIQDEHVLKKERKRIANDESSKRSRIRRKQQYDLLQAKVETLSNETSMLSYELKKHSKYCLKLKRENKFLLEELKHTCGSDVIFMLEAKNPDRVLQSTDGESNIYSRGSQSEHNVSPDQSIDTSNSSWEVEADSD